MYPSAQSTLFGGRYIEAPALPPPHNRALIGDVYILLIGLVIPTSSPVGNVVVLAVKVHQYPAKLSSFLATTEEYAQSPMQSTLDLQGVGVSKLEYNVSVRRIIGLEHRLTMESVADTYNLGLLAPHTKSAGI